LLVNACTSEEANTKHVEFVGDLAILHKWKNTLPQHEQSYAIRREPESSIKLFFSYNT
jgi:hypothetical protein